MILVSVLIPTRKRINRLKKCLDSFNNKTKDKTIVELILKIDDDDLETIEFIKTYNSEINLKYIISSRENGYGSLHKFYNMMASISIGEFLYIFNDDIYIDTHEWEQIILEYSGKFIILAHDTFVYEDSPKFQETGSNIFTPGLNGNPILPRKIFELWGFISENPMVDYWFELIKKHLTEEKKTVEKWVDIKCFTDRPDGHWGSSELDSTFHDGIHCKDWGYNVDLVKSCVNKIKIFIT
jgi:glycosyltransferase involved in cell wall biosynthesis